VKNSRAIAEYAVDQVFDAAKVQSLAVLARLPTGCDLDRFGERLRMAARTYAQNALQESTNQQNREIAELYRRADRRDYEGLAKAVEAMTPSVRILLAERRARLGERVPHWRIPEVAELHDPVTCAQATEGLLALLEQGGRTGEGRMRPTGRRSRSWFPDLYAPHASRAEPRREAERELVLWLQVAVAETGAKVPVTAHHDKPGPFACMAAEVLQLVGATGSANAKGLAIECIKQLHKLARRR
jgi:hypothetical protein